jgi:hypothetical protein
VDEHLRPDRSGVFIRLTKDERLITGFHPFAIMVTLVNPDALNARGLISAIMAALQAELATLHSLFWVAPSICWTCCRRKIALVSAFLTSWQRLYSGTYRSVAVYGGRISRAIPQALHRGLAV